MKNINIFALAAHGEGISGGDRIFIELTRNWSKDCQVKLFVTDEGYRTCLRHKLERSNVQFQISNIKKWAKYGFVINYIARIIEGLRLGFTLKLENNSETLVYSASEFWMDSLSAFLLKLRHPVIKWIAAWYQTAPNPLIGFNEGGRKNKYYISAFFYFLAQLPIKPLINKYADLILVNNILETNEFSSLKSHQKVMVFLGAVDLDQINKYRKEFKGTPKKYDGVFQGRFHPQKGVVELIDIWKKVVKKKPDALLAMIGDGPLMESVKLKVKTEKLEENIKLFGYLFDGPEKYRIFAQSKVVLHPSFFDSGGMASAEAMAFGLPCVGFDLPAFEDYYPQGMIKTKKGDLEDFSQNILNLLSNTALYEKISQDALKMIQNGWSWELRASQVLNKLDHKLPIK